MQINSGIYKRIGTLLSLMHLRHRANAGMTPAQTTAASDEDAGEIPFEPEDEWDDDDDE